MEKYSELLTVKFTNRMYRDLKSLAEKEFITISQYIRKLVREAHERSINGKEESKKEGR